MVDNSVLLATHKVTIAEEISDEHKKEFIHFQNEDFGFVVYNDDELVALIDLLQNKAVRYAAEEIAYENETMKKAKNGRYLSRTEALEDLDVHPLSIQEYRDIKIAVLNERCNKEILGTFSSSATGVDHVYSLDMEAQMNIVSTEVLFNKNIIAEIDWNTRDAGVVVHNKSQFEQLIVDATVHKMGLINHYRNKKDIVNSCMTKNDVDLIEW